MCILNFMQKFDKISIETILFSFLNAYMIVVMSAHFHFMYFGDQCEMLPKFYQNYDVRFLCI